MSDISHEKLKKYFLTEEHEENEEKYVLKPLNYSKHL